MHGLSDEPFVGYTFEAAPPRRQRLWFLDRHVRMLVGVEGWSITDVDGTGTWTMVRRGWNPVKVGPCLRYDHGEPPWSAVWRLTDVSIPHVHTFGRDDDVWRLGVWPD
jgi:hypothetical protein